MFCCCIDRRATRETVKSETEWDFLEGSLDGVGLSGKGGETEAEKCLFNLVKCLLQYGQPNWNPNKVKSGLEVVWFRVPCF